jgi:Tryptophanase
MTTPLPFEPYRSRVVEPIRLSTPQERRRWIAQAGYNPFLLKAEQVMIDLVTDSGTSALSVAQWAAMHGSDESFTGSASFERLVAAARALFGHPHVIPCHQGRAGEHLLARAVLRPGDVVLANTLFATTRVNFEEAGARCEDLPSPAALSPQSRHPFKGNIDLERLAARLEAEGTAVRLVVLTVTDNARGGQPVALANLRAASELCRRHGVPLWLDAARVAENCYLIKEREEGCGHRSPADLAREVFSLVDGAFMSMKKDGLGNVGGLITCADPAWAEAIRARLLISEGIPSAGGLAGRDLECMRVALEEMLDEAHLAWRVAATGRLAQRLLAGGVPVLQPVGAHAVYVDGRAFCPHLPDEQFPAWSVSAAYYLASGVRTWEAGNVTYGRLDPATGRWSWPAFDLVRLALPRRVYSDAHLAYAADALVELFARRQEIRGLRCTYRPPALPQFIARFAPVGADDVLP